MSDVSLGSFISVEALKAPRQRPSYFSVQRLALAAEPHPQIPAASRSQPALTHALLF